jgi:6-phosphogluconolactonase (cycloisomerase 2 family)
MKSPRFLFLFLLCLPIAALAQSASKPASASYLITNDDLPPKTAATAGTVFTVGSDGTPQNPFKVTLGGSGAGGGYFTASRVSVLQNSACAYLSLGGAGEIGGVDLTTLQDVDNFSGSSTDAGGANGIGLVNNGTYLYASYSTSNTIAAFSILPGCALSFLGDISPLGLQGGNVTGMAVHGNILVVAFGDGSIQSFNTASGIPVSNGDLQNASGYVNSLFPSGVDITSDGHYAIFGDISTTSTVEVSDISSGKLKKTAVYNIGSAGNSTNVFLSPDETLLYVTNSDVGKVTAAFFNTATGKITPGCTSAKLKGFETNYLYVSSPVAEMNTGTGSLLYVAEFGAVSAIAMLDVTSSGGKCTLTERASSPVVSPNSTTLLSIGVYPPRQF